MVEFIVLSYRFCYGALLSRLLEISAIKISYYYYIILNVVTRNLPYSGTSVDHVGLEVQVSAKYLQSSLDQVIDHAMYIVYQRMILVVF